MVTFSISKCINAGLGSQSGAVLAAHWRQQPRGRALELPRELGAAGRLCAAAGGDHNLCPGACSVCIHMLVVQPASFVLLLAGPIIYAHMSVYASMHMSVVIMRVQSQPGPFARSYLGSAGAIDIFCCHDCLLM